MRTTTRTSFPRPRGFFQEEKRAYSDRFPISITFTGSSPCSKFTDCSALPSSLSAISRAAFVLPFSAALNCPSASRCAQVRFCSSKAYLIGYRPIGCGYHIPRSPTRVAAFPLWPAERLRLPRVAAHCFRTVLSAACGFGHWHYSAGT
jgi:hypothetical protein